MIQMEAIKPISPSEARRKAKESMPVEVFEAVNAMLVHAMKTNGIQVVLYQDELIVEIIKVFQKAGREVIKEEIFDNGWLNFEDHYRAAGWVVKYDVPGFNEDYRAHFIFTAKS